MLGKRSSKKADNRLHPTARVTLPDHVVAVAWSADGGTVAAAAIAGPIFLFDATTGKVHHTLTGHGFGTAAIAWQPGGTILASAGQDGHARLWNSITGEKIAALPGGSAWVETLAWSADGSQLATGAGKTVKVWNATGETVATFGPLASTTYDLAWIPNTKQLTTAAYNGAKVWSLDSKVPIRSFEWKGSPLKLAWSPDGKMLAHGNQDSTVHFWYAATGLDLQMYGYANKVRELSWDYSSRYLATGGGSVVCIWDCSGKGPEGSKPQMLGGHTEEGVINAVAFQHGGPLLASAGRDGRVFLWQPGNRKGPGVGSFEFTNAEATVLAWSPTDKHLASANSNGEVVVLRVS